MIYILVLNTTKGVRDKVEGLYILKIQIKDQSKESKNSIDSLNKIISPDSKKN
jgi:hypothetical protein